MANRQPPLPITEKLAYGLGDAAANLIFQTQITFLMFFYTDVFGIASATAGTILLASRLIDAFIDPVVGALADRTTTRWGRYRPWVLLTAVPLSVALVLCYTTPALGTFGKIVWAVVTYNALMILYTANNIPYCALAGVMTSDTLERTSLVSWRFVCAMLATLVVNVLTVDLVRLFGRGNSAVGFQATMGVWGGLAVVLLVITFLGTKERVYSRTHHRSTIRKDLSDLLRNGPWFVLFLLALLIHLQLALRSGSMLYYFQHYLQLGRAIGWIDNFGIFNGVGLLFTILGITLSKPLSQRFGKRTTFRACLLLSAVAMAAFAVLPTDSLVPLLMLQILLQLAFGPTIPILWAMMADVVDYSEWRKGRRSTALAFASIIFGLKLGLGGGAWITGGLLTFFGYSANVAITTSMQQGLLYMVSVIPAAVLLVCVVILFFYRLDDQLMGHIEQSLVARRAASDPELAT